MYYDNRRFSDGLCDEIRDRLVDQLRHPVGVTEAMRIAEKIALHLREELALIWPEDAEIEVSRQAAAVEGMEGQV